jgi:hypothetical protein
LFVSFSWVKQKIFQFRIFLLKHCEINPPRPEVFVQGSARKTAGLAFTDPFLGMKTSIFVKTILYDLFKSKTSFARYNIWAARFQFSVFSSKPELKMS